MTPAHLDLVRGLTATLAVVSALLGACAHAAPEGAAPGGPSPEGVRWPALGPAAPPLEGREQDVALVISIENYSDVADVPGATLNGDAWYTWFTETLSLRPDRVKWLKDNQGTPAQILAAVRDLRGRVGKGGTFWLVFIGHGAPTADGKDGVLVGYSAQQTADELYAQSLAQSRLLAELEQGGQAGNVLIIDSCFSGRTSDGASLAPTAQVTLLHDRPARLPPNTAVLTAGRSNEFAQQLPFDRRPAFSHLVLGALRGWADDGRYGNGDGAITVAEVVEYAGAALAATASRNQTPQGFGETGRVLVKLPAKAREPGPNLVAIKRRGEAAPPSGPAVDRAPSATLGGGAKDVGGGLAPSILDLDALTQAQKLKDAIDRAKATEADERTTPTQRAEAWDAVASLLVKGQNPYAAEARQNAASWRAVAAKTGELRENWAKLKEALKLSVLDLGQKKELVGKLLEAYAGLSSEQAYQEAMEAKRTLDGGNAFPLGGGAPDAVVGSGSGSGSAPKGYVEIPAGSFTMGSPESEADRSYDEKQRRVTITRPFWLKATEVTQGEWQAVMGSNPSQFSSCGSSCPVEKVSWEDTIAYLNKLSEREGLSLCYGSDGSFRGLRCEGYRLPTEAEWEYAARADTAGVRYWALDSVAWYDLNSGSRTHPVGQKQPNAWGLYDMLGNVWEWVHDWHGAYGGDAADPVGPGSGELRVIRGGSWNGGAGNVRAADRDGGSPSSRFGFRGFRPARSVP